MKHLIKLIILSLGLTSALQASAAAPSTTDIFANCMIDTLNGKERKNLAKWVFFAVAAHPEIKTYANATPQDIEESDKYVGALITRLLTENCPKELQAASKDDPLALQKGFQLVGQVAMQELMADQSVMKAISNYAHYADQDKINAVLSNK